MHYTGGMPKWWMVIVAFFCLSIASEAQSIEAANGVVERLIGERAKEFDLGLSQPYSEHDTYVVFARDGKVTVRGTTGVAICRGVYDYLKNACGCLVTWDGDQLNLPARFPDYPRTEVRCPNQYRHYFNVCTFGYTMAFWDWNRWQREIDWMALHGINMPLSMTGQEKVWQTVWKSYGVKDIDIRSFFGGPAFLPWHWMGNQDGNAGPMPQAFLDYAEGLQKKIISRELELGMHPVTPAFAGFVPKAFAEKHKGSKIIPSSGWAGFEPTYQLSPNDPLFKEIGARFIKEYIKTYGTDHLYLADVFNEMTPQVGKGTRLEDLKATAIAIYESILAGDPHGIWVSQGWLFHNDPGFWKDPEVEAYLSGIPNDRMILLDLAGEEDEMWRLHKAFRDKLYIWNLLHNYGQRTRLFGNLDLIASKPIKALNDPGHGQMAGMGLTMEGIQQNAPIYELMTDIMWRNQPIYSGDWLSAYSRQRYGFPGAEPLWDSIHKTIYGGVSSVWSLQPYQTRPSLGSVSEPGVPNPNLRALIDLMLSESPDIRQSPLFRRDLVDVAKGYIGEAISNQIGIVVEAISTGNSSEVRAQRARFDSMMVGLDALLATIPQHRLDHWIEMARNTVESKADKDLLEKNARMQITIWGGPVLNEYAAKEWSGLVSDFYRRRWNLLFDAMLKPAFDEARFAKDIVAFDEKWCEATTLPKPEAVDALDQTKTLLAIIDSMKPIPIDRGIAVGKPATDSGHTEPGGSPANAVDGSASGGYWAANPYPQWWQVDLEKPAKIDKIQVFTYSGDGRYYQYTVDVSLDGKNWTQVVDFSKNTKIASGRGFVHDFKPIEARYIRVNMLKNSANVGVHLREVRVFAAK